MGIGGNGIEKVILAHLYKLVLQCTMQITIANSIINEDASKSFDHVNYYVLFFKLLQLGSPLYLINFFVIGISNSVVVC